MPLRIWKRAFIWLGLALWCTVGAMWGSPAGAEEPRSAEFTPPSETIRAAVAKSLPLLETGARGSLEQRKQCFTCHNQGLPIQALTTARSRGFEIDDEHLRTQLQFTANFLGRNKTNYLAGKGQGGQIDTAGYALWALDNGSWKPDETTAAVAEYLLLFQKDSDHWQPQSKRPPSEQSPFTSSYVALRGLKAFGTQDQQERIAARRAQIREWLLKAAPTETEDRVFRLRGLHLVEAPAEDLRRVGQELLSAQGDDGGWSQLPDLHSDAYATGTALVALHQTGMLPVDSVAYRKGLSFLLKTQLEDGSWHVASRSKPFQTYFESGYPHGKDQFISIAAAGWATTALALALPVAEPPPKALFAAEAPSFISELIFPLNSQHNHAPGIAACPNGDLFVSWYRGGGERKADDVAVYGAWQAKGETAWSEPFVLADTPGFPDCNTTLFLDDRQRLWLFYPTILANTWESCLTNFKVSSKFARPGLPHWEREGLILMKPHDFSERATKQLDADLALVKSPLNDKMREEIEQVRRRLGDKLYQRLGWQPRCKPTQLPSGRLLLPLYSDTYSLSIMAISDDHGQTWRAGQPMLGFGAIQPTVLRRNDGTLVAYMRENGFTQRIRVCESKDDGESWGPVGVSELPNPGSGLDGIRLTGGSWLLVYNDSVSDRQRLVVSLSPDEGRTWTRTRVLEDQPQGAFHYPAITQGRDGTIHVVYSYFVEQGKSMKHAAFSESWIQSGESRDNK